VQHLLFPIIILIIAISRAFASARRDPGGPPPPRTSSRSASPTESDAERQRRFREAVGLPLDAPLPPPIRPRTTASPPPLQPVMPPPVLGMPTAPGRLRRIYTGVPTQPGTPGTQPTARRIPAPAPAPASAAPPPAPVQQIAPPAPAPQTYIPYTPSRPPAAPAAPAPQPSFPAAGLLARLRDPAAVREAIILREILGPPKALQGTPLGAPILSLQ
jgi:hypothetical protein